MTVTHLIPISHAIAERVIRTIKGKISRYFTLSKSKEYISVLDSIADNYNNSFNSAIGMSPNEVGFHNTKWVFDRLYMGKHGSRYPSVRISNKDVKFKFSIGDYVRITKSKKSF